MVDKPKEPGRFKTFFIRIRQFLTRRQSKRVAKIYRQTFPENPPLPPSPPASAPASAAPTTRGAPPSGPEPEEIRRNAERVERLRQIEEEARREREEIEEKVAAQRPPVRDIGELEQRKGFVYTTWFKAFGTFGDIRDMGTDSPQLLGEMEELEDFDVPAAFYSSGILGKVKWKGYVERETIIDQLNTVAPWNGADFRDVYPRWEYRYFVAEMVGNVVVQTFEYKAKHPMGKKDGIYGFRNY